MLRCVEASEEWGIWVAVYFLMGIVTEQLANFFFFKNYSFGCVLSLLQHAESLHVGFLDMVHGLFCCVGS